MAFLTTNADWSFGFVFEDKAGKPISFGGLGTYVASLKYHPDDAEPLIAFAASGETGVLTIVPSTVDGLPADVIQFFAAHDDIKDFSPGRLFGDIVRTDGGRRFLFNFELPLIKGITP